MRHIKEEFFRKLNTARSTALKHTWILSLSSQGEGAHNGGVEDEMWGVLGHSTQQAAYALADVCLWMVETGKKLGDDT